MSPGTGRRAPLHVPGMQISSRPRSGAHEGSAPWELLGRAWGEPSGDPVWPWGPRVTWSSHGALSPAWEPCSGACILSVSRTNRPLRSPPPYIPF